MPQEAQNLVHQLVQEGQVIPCHPAMKKIYTLVIYFIKQQSQTGFGFLLYKFICIKHNRYFYLLLLHALNTKSRRKKSMLISKVIQKKEMNIGRPHLKLAYS